MVLSFLSILCRGFVDLIVVFAAGVLVVDDPDVALAHGADVLICRIPSFCVGFFFFFFSCGGDAGGLLRANGRCEGAAGVARQP